jgi:fluoride exporter
MKEEAISMGLIYIGIFGLLGVFGRYFIGLFFNKFFQSSLPYDTFLINIVGAFVIGIIYVLGIEKAQITQELRVGIMVGFLGGFTTFSSYCLDAVRLFESYKYLQGFLYISLSPIVGTLATILGIFLARRI